MRLLVVEDEPRLRQHLAEGLRAIGFAVDPAATLEEGRALVAAAPYDAMVLDRALPDGDGLDLLRGLRSAGRATPALLLTARDAVADRVEGLDAGADDYLVKPFAFDELAARLRALLRRPQGRLGRVLALGRLAFDTVERAVTVDSRPLLLPRHELAALELLLRRAGRVVAKEALLDALYDLEGAPETNTVPVHIHNLRRRLGEAGAGVRVTTLRGLGYLLEADA